MLGSQISFPDYDTASSELLLRRSNCGKVATGMGGSAWTPLNEDVHDLLECPVCMTLMYPPIYQIPSIQGLYQHLEKLSNLHINSYDVEWFIVVCCTSPKLNSINGLEDEGGTIMCPNGHTLCSSCKTKLENLCPTCRHELGDIRCLVLEKVAESLELPCRFHLLGCSGIFPYYSKLKHEKNCKHRPYACPYAGADCSVTGDIPLLVMHLKDDHNVDMHDGCTFNHRYVKSNPREVENATWMLTIFNCFGRQFCLHFEAFQLEMAPVYMAFLRFMGNEDEAKQFSYSLEVGGNHRRLIWQGIPRSIRDSHRKVRDSQDGLIIPRTLALSFSGGNGQELKLKVAGRIWKNSDIEAGYYS